MGGKSYPGYTIYVAAIFSFYKIISSTINIFHAAKDESTLLLSFRRIGYADACFSILVAFSNEIEGYSIMMNTLTGGIVCLLVLIMGIEGVISSRKMKRGLEKSFN